MRQYQMIALPIRQLIVTDWQDGGRVQGTEQLRNY